MQALLDFDGSFIYAENPSAYLEVLSGKIFLNNQLVGTATDLGRLLTLPQSSDFFPAWIGFIGYEYARYFGLATHTSDFNFPDAAFFRFDQGSSYARKIRAPSLNSKLRSRFKQQDYLNAIQAIQKEIRQGDVYQVNLARQFDIEPGSFDPFWVYEELKKHNPSPYMGVLQHPEWSIVSGSPERLFRLQDRTISTKPIAGTKPASPTGEQELRTSPKEMAEHSMLVDLMRNDLSRVCETGSVEVPKPFHIERYPHVYHLVSEVTGRTQVCLQEILHSLFPGGTITGAPKENVMRAIQRYESVPRGPYTGSFGYVSSGQGVDFNILIRSLFMGKKRSYFAAGAGIVMGSEPENEFQETAHKIKQFEFLTGSNPF